MLLQKQILVTGGAGFLGSHLCERLLAEGANVICVDNFFTGTRLNVENLLPNPRFEVIRHDVTFPLYIEVNEIYNLACPASPIHYQRDPVQTTKTTVHGAINMLGLAKRIKATILQASTSEVYGDPLVHPQREDYWGQVNPIGPGGGYDEAKRFAEAMTMAYHRVHRVDTRIARVFNTFGPKMRLNDGRAIPAFMTQALRSEPLTVFGDGSQTRSFQYITDLIDGVWRLMQAAVNEPVNLGNPQEMTLLELAKRILRLTGARSEIVFRPLPVDDPKVRQPDITRARALLGWEPRVDTDEGLKLTLDWFTGALRRRSDGK